MRHKQSKELQQLEKCLSIMDDLSGAASNAVGELPKIDTDTLRKGGLSLTEVALLMARLKNLHEIMDNNKKAIGVLYDKSRHTFLPEMMADEDVTVFKVEGLGRVGLTDDLNVKVLDKDAEFEWLEQNGNGDMIGQTVNASSLKSLLRRMLVAGEEIPASIFEVKPFTRASITKG